MSHFYVELNVACRFEAKHTTRYATILQV